MRVRERLSPLTNSLAAHIPRARSLACTLLHAPSLLLALSRSDSLSTPFLPLTVSAFFSLHLSLPRSSLEKCFTCYDDDTPARQRWHVHGMSGPASRGATRAFQTNLVNNEDVAGIGAVFAVAGMTVCGSWVCL